MPARRLERARREARCRAVGVVLYLRCLRSPSALCAGEDVIARIVFARARLVVEGSTVDVLPVGDPDVTSRYRFRAAGLSMVVMPERRMSACLSFVKGLGLALLAVMLPIANRGSRSSPSVPAGNIRPPTPNTQRGAG